jgi:hypothetical protein
METVLSHFNLHKIAKSSFEKEVSSLIMDDVDYSPAYNNELMQLLLLECTSPLCFAKGAFVLMIAQDLKNIKLVSFGMIDSILSTTKTPLGSWLSKLYFKSLELHFSGQHSELLTFLKELKRPTDFANDAAFTLFILVLSTLNKNDDICTYATQYAHNFIQGTRDMVFSNIFASSQDLIASKEPFVHAYLIAYCFSSDSENALQNFLHNSDEVGFFEAILFHYIQRLTPIEVPFSVGCPKQDFLGVSAQKTTSLALGSFSYSDLYVPAFGFADARGPGQEFFFFNPHLSSFIDNSALRSKLLVGLSESCASYCHLELVNSEKSFEIQAHLEGKVSRELALFVRADQIQPSQKKLLQKGSLDQFSATIKSFKIIHAKKQFSISMGSAMLVQIKPLAGGAYFWTADFLVSILLSPKNRTLALKVCVD